MSSPAALPHIREWPPLCNALLPVVAAMWLSYTTLPSTITRATSNRWRLEAVTMFDSAHPRSPEESLSLKAASWLSLVLDSDILLAHFLDSDETVRGFVEIHWLGWSMLTDELVRLLNSLTTRVHRQAFGSQLPVQRVQHNPLEDLVRCEDEEYLPPPPDLDAVEDLSAPPLSSPVNSPPHKRPRLPSACELWEAFQSDVDQKLAASALWGETLDACPAIWPLFLSKCAYLLRKALPSSQLSPADSENVLVEDVIYVIRRVRWVLPRTFRTKGWSRVVRSTGFAEAALAWSEPSALACWRQGHIVKLFRFHRVDVVLLVVLLAWTPSSVPLLDLDDPWPSLAPYLLPLPLKVPKRFNLRFPQDVMKVIRTVPDIIPFSSYPASVFFLLSPDNFAEAWRSWFLFVLRARGYQTSHWELPGGNVKPTLFRLLIQSLAEKAKSECVDLTDLSRDPVAKFQYVTDPRVEVVLRRTAQFHHLKKDLNPSDIPGSEAPGLLKIQGRTSFVEPCHDCLSRLPEDRCVQDVVVEVYPTPSEHLGCGITYASREEVLPTTKLSRRPSKKPKPEPKPVLHPDELGLEEIACNEEVISRCHIQVIRFVDSDGNLLDFLAYNAIPEVYLQRMLLHFDQFARMKGLVRGEQFHTYMQGSMVPRGERTPSGGAPGDCHRYYDSLKATDLGSIHALFDNAEASLPMPIVAVSETPSSSFPKKLKPPVRRCRNQISANDGDYSGYGSGAVAEVVVKDEGEQYKEYDEPPLSPLSRQGLLCRDTVYDDVSPRVSTTKSMVVGSEVSAGVYRTRINLSAFDAVPPGQEQSHDRKDSIRNPPNEPQLGSSPVPPRFIDLPPLTTLTPFKGKLPVTFGEVKQWLSKNKGKKSQSWQGGSATASVVHLPPQIELQGCTGSTKELSLSDLLKSKGIEISSDWEDTRTPTNGHTLASSASPKRKPATSAPLTDTEQRDPQVKRVLPLARSQSSESRYVIDDQPSADLAKRDRYLSATPDSTS
ncbi:hypothetical protein FA13DRAFT_1790051 [Coprinellus micaceus]|uniref:Uncharacterized protein n=1 Tax=Coprinellus micaceus TaxID=71717 RepID=A0A4Y7TFN2_COPMI|nr:hypothetical protein FA13DRAFT_1790051 [Coprinellus micaceus]